MDSDSVVRVHDFESSNHGRSTLTPLVEDQPTAPTPQSPGAQGSSRMQSASARRESVSSHLSAVDSNGMRFRKPARSNTVTAFHVPESTPAGETWQPGAEPGVDTSAEDENIPDSLTNLRAWCDINIIDFSDQGAPHVVKANNDNLAAALDAPRTEELPCRWISVNGLSWDVIKLLGNRYHLHDLAIEDLMHTRTRTKVDWYADQAFIVLTLQKLVLLHQHKGSSENCNCANASDADSEDIDKGFERYSSKGDGSWWSRLMGKTKRRKADILPHYLDRNGDGKVDEFVSAHSGLSEKTPIKPIRTLHRYESAQIPEHTAWMEKHSALADDDMAVSVEQVAIFLLSDNCVISFFEQSAEDVEDPILERLYSKETMLRRSCDASLLLQAIIDAIVDLASPVKDAYNKARKELQIDAMTNPNIKTSRSLHIFGEEIDMLQNLFKPIVHLVNSLRDHNLGPVNATSMQTAPPPAMDGSFESPNTDKTKRDREGAPVMGRQMSEFKQIALRRADNATSVTITPLAHTYFGDVLDHCITMISALEQMDASANNISTLIFNTVGAKTNNFMMILAVVTVFFAPLTFVSGYFGMNFSNGDGLDHAFAFFWVVAVPSLVGFMLLVFGVMLWDNIRDWLSRRGVKTRWHMRIHKRPRTGMPPPLRR